jgi:hypothetical protein
LSKAGNTVKLDNIVDALLRELAERLPPGWRILPAGTGGGKRASAVRPGESTLKIRAPRGKTGAVLVQTKDRWEPKDVDFLAAKLRPVGRMPVIIATPFLTARTRQRFKGERPWVR